MRAASATRDYAVRDVHLERWSIVSHRSFDDIVSRLSAAIGHPDMAVFREALTAARNAAELQAVVEPATGSSGLMEFVRFDAGEILRKEQGEGAPKILRLVVGNPLIMKEMVKKVPDAASYAPVTILIDQRNDGVHLSYDLMTSLVAPYGNEAVIKIAEDLDAKVENLLKTAAR